MAKKFKTPYAEYLPPLRSHERAALEASIAADGVRDPIYVSEDNCILDGHNRYDIAPSKCKTVVVPGLTEAQKEAFVFGNNNMRRNMTPEERAELRERMKTVAKKLKELDRLSQEEIAVKLGVDRTTVTKWFGEVVSDVNDHNPYHDNRIKLSREDEAEIYERVSAGESLRHVAADFGVTHPRVHQIVAKHEAKQQEIIDRQAKAKEIEDLLGDEDHGVKIGDFREVSKQLPDGSVDLIFTDPPYDTASLPLYGDMAKVASRVLRDGGSLLTFGPQACIPELISLIAVDGIKWYWVCGCLHTGKSSRMAASGIVVTWKPILWFVKGSQRYDTSVFVKDSVQSVQEKDAHPWQQSVVEARYYIDNLSPENGMVFDPFCGGGTTAVAAKQAGRRWLTCDVHNEHALIARGRVVES